MNISVEHPLYCTQHNCVHPCSPLSTAYASHSEKTLATMRVTSGMYFYRFFAFRCCSKVEVQSRGSRWRYRS
jgi:hypothetical protein